MSPKRIALIVLGLASVVVALFFMFRGHQVGVPEVLSGGAQSKEAPLQVVPTNSQRQLAKEPSGQPDEGAEGRSFRVACVDADGRPVAGARLQIRSGGTLKLVAHQSDETGRFSGEFVEPVVSVGATIPGIGAGSIAITEDDLDQESVLVLRRLSTLDVTVVGERGALLESATVSVRVGGVESGAGMLPSVPVPALTDSAGRCSFELEPQGIYSVRAKSSAGQASAVQKVHLQQGGRQSVTILVGVSPVIRGRVLNGDGDGIVGAVVSGFLADNVFQSPKRIRPALSDDQGVFALAVPHYGRYQVLARHSEHALESIEWFDVGLGEADTEDRVLRMHEVEFIKGTVLDSSGRGCEGLQVSASPRVDWGRGYTSRSLDSLFLLDSDTGQYRFQNAATTDAMGQFALPLRPWLAGEWRVSAHGTRAEGSVVWHGARDVLMPADAMRDVVVEVASVGAPGAVVKIRVAGSNGELWALRNERKKGVWMMDWVQLPSDLSASGAEVHVPIDALGGAVAIGAGGSSMLLIGSDLSVALAAGQVQLEPSWPVSFELTDPNGAHELAGIGHGRLRVTIQHESGCVLSPTVLRVDSEKDAATAYFPRGSYSAIFQQGWRIVTTKGFKVPRDGRIISVRR
jgi:hypothetical protein